jgi:hypothetical protein
MSMCSKTSDNKHFDCPPRMDDGRHFTDYRPSCHVNDLLKNDNAISNSFQYRQFMTHNAETIMDKHRQIACAKNCCTPCASSPLGVEGFNNGTMLPEKYMTECSGSTCKTVLNDPNGVGHGRKYFTNNVLSDCNDMPKAWPVSQGTNKCAAPLDNFAYLGDLEKEMMPKMERVAVPGAGNVLSGGDPTSRINM